MTENMLRKKIYHIKQQISKLMCITTYSYLKDYLKFVTELQNRFLM